MKQFVNNSDIGTNHHVRDVRCKPSKKTIRELGPYLWVFNSAYL